MSYYMLSDNVVVESSSEAAVATTFHFHDPWMQYSGFYPTELSIRIHSSMLSSHVARDRTVAYSFAYRNIQNTILCIPVPLRNWDKKNSILRCTCQVTLARVWNQHVSLFLYSMSTVTQSSCGYLVRDQ